MPLLVVAAGLLAYCNSFTGPFIFDDEPSILENPTIRHLWPIWNTLTPLPGDNLPVNGRPLINLSLAVNYALGGYNVWGYHTLNLAVHILAGLGLLGVVRRTLLQPRLQQRFGVAANELALAVAVLWTVHPLQTESVTYVIQRCESFMGLFYLLMLYCFIRGAGSARPHVWYGLCVTACALGMASKEAMVAAPLIVLLYDRVFLASSFRDLWRRRTALYVGLAATWLILAVLVVKTHHPNTGFKIKDLTPWDYLKTEAGVIVHYLRLCLWPRPLVIDYSDWPITRLLKDSLVPGIVVAGLLGATAWAFRHRSRMAFLGAWFFLILAPTSSILPSLGEVAAERRMYLPLAAVIVLVVMGIHALAGRRSMPVFLGLAVGLGFLTVQRNQDYRSSIAIWGDTVAKRPGNLRAHYNLGVALSHVGRFEEAIGHYEQALRFAPDDAEAQNNWGVCLSGLGKMQEAIAHYEQALRLKPDYAEAHNNLGLTLSQIGRIEDAIGHYEQALRIKPDYSIAHFNLGIAFGQTGRVQEEIEQYQQALRINPAYAKAHRNLGIALEQRGRVQEAIEQYQQVLRINPDDAEVQNNLGTTLAQTGRGTEAIEHFEEAVRIKPDYTEAQYNLGVALIGLGRLQEAMGHWEQALRSKPDYAEAENSLAWLLATLAPADGGDPVRAVTLAERACELTNNRVAGYLDTLAVAYAAAGRFNDAIATAQKAIEMAGTAGQHQLVREIETRLKSYRAGQAWREPTASGGN